MIMMMITLVRPRALFFHVHRTLLTLVKRWEYMSDISGGTLFAGMAAVSFSLNAC
jgi:hypothetical protein